MAALAEDRGLVDERQAQRQHAVHLGVHQQVGDAAGGRREDGVLMQLQQHSARLDVLAGKHAQASQRRRPHLAVRLQPLATAALLHKRHCSLSIFHCRAAHITSVYVYVYVYVFVVLVLACSSAMR